MKVLHVAPYFPPHRVGGVGVFVARLHRALLAAGVASEVWTRAPSGAEMESGVERIASSRVGWLGALTARVARTRAFDVVHVHGGEALPFLVALHRLPRRPRVVATWHVSSRALFRAADSPGAKLRAIAHGVADRLALPRIDAVAPITRALAEDVFGPERGAVAPVILHGVAAPSPATRALRRSGTDLLYVGVAGRRKRVDALPEILAIVLRAHPDARLRIAGFAPADAPELRDAFAAHGLADRVDWAGALPPEELADAYRAAGVLVAPSVYEGVPLAVLEAMQHACPVIATDIAGHAFALEEGVTGHLVPVDDPAAMAERCAALLGDARRRRAMGEAAAKAVRERFDLDRHVRAYRDLYERVCAEAA